MGSPTDEVGSKDDQSFLEIDSRLRTHLDVVELEDLFAFLDTRFDELSTIIAVEPSD